MALQAKYCKDSASSSDLQIFSVDWRTCVPETTKQDTLVEASCRLLLTPFHSSQLSRTLVRNVYITGVTPCEPESRDMRSYSHFTSSSDSAVKTGEGWATGTSHKENASTVLVVIVSGNGTLAAVAEVGPAVAARHLIAAL